MDCRVVTNWPLLSVTPVAAAKTLFPPEPASDTAVPDTKFPCASRAMVVSVDFDELLAMTLFGLASRVDVLAAGVPLRKAASAEKLRPPAVTKAFSF